MYLYRNQIEINNNSSQKNEKNSINQIRSSKETNNKIMKPGINQHIQIEKNTIFDVNG